MSDKDKGIGRLMKEVLYGIENDVFRDPAGEAMLRIWMHGVANKRIKAMIHQRVRSHRFKRAISGDPFLQPRLHSGEIIVGLDKQRDQILMPLQYFNAHEICVAGSGAGKTNRGRFIALQVIPRTRGVWLFDLRKREWRVLAPLLRRLGVEIFVIDGRSLKINPLEVPLGVSPADWAARVSDLLVSVFGLPQRAGKLIQSRLIKLYRKAGIFRGSRTYPTMFHLFEAIKNDRKANPQARAAVLDNLEPVLLSLGPSVLAYHEGWSTDALSRHPIVFELAGITDIDRDLILGWLCVSEFMSRIARGISNTKMDLWISFDEAQRLCSADQTSVIGDLIGLVRGTGIGLSLSVQSFHGLAPAVISNTSCKVIGRCGSDTDYTPIARSIGMTADEQRWATLNLKPGLMIGSLGEGKWRRPFVFRVPYLDFTKLSPQENTSSQPPNAGPVTSIPVVEAPNPSRLI